MTDPTSEQLLDRFNSGHLGPAHGIANVLCFIASHCGDPRSWEAIPRRVLVELAMELTADLPWPYGRTPEQQAAIEAACAQHMQDCRVSATSDEPAVSNDREPASVTDQITQQLHRRATVLLIRKVIDQAIRDTASVHWRVADTGEQLVRASDLLAWADHMEKQMQQLHDHPHP